MVAILYIFASINIFLNKCYGVYYFYLFVLSCFTLHIYDKDTMKHMQRDKVHAFKNRYIGNFGDNTACYWKEIGIVVNTKYNFDMVLINIIII